MSTLTLVFNDEFGFFEDYKVSMHSTTWVSKQEKGS